uniref:EamA domain-containing protein n=1 Tax=Spongospora subterranea TaxID=70186 RepID=A0A0H5QI86_9EUKA|eukprot:CRZ01755.1 hypothetical protein [Spongospora subterranea]
MAFLYNWSLSRTSLSSSMILSTTSSVFTLMFSCLLTHHDPATTAKVIGVVATLGGACLVALLDNIRSPYQRRASSLAGDGAALGAAVLSGIYTVGLRKRIGWNTQRLQTMTFFSWMGIYVICVGGPIMAILHLTSIYVITVPSIMTFIGLGFNAISSVISDVIWAKAILLTSPLIATVPN